MHDNCVTGIIAGENHTHFQIAVDSEGDCKGCGMSSVCSSKTVELEKASLSEKLRIGQKVSLEYKRVIQTSFIVYIIPILFFFLGIGLTKWILHINNELILFVNAILATGISLILVHYINKNYGSSKYKVDVKLLNLF